MAKKKDSYKDMKKGELEKELQAKRNDLRSIRFKAEGARSKNVKEIQTLRRSIAQILTALSAQA